MTTKVFIQTYRPRSITVLFQIGGSLWIFELYGDLVAVLKGKFERDYRIQTLKRSTERGNRRYLSPLQPCIDTSTHPCGLEDSRSCMLCVCCLCNATLPSMDKSCRPLTVYPASRCRLCASTRSRLDAPVIWRKLLPADSASCRLPSAMVSWIISRLVV